MALLAFIVFICSLEICFSLHLRCPSGIDAFAANLENNSYYKCIDGLAVLKSCDLSMEYDRKSGNCVNLNLSRRKRDLTKASFNSIIDSDALGRIVTLGNLYDARTNKIFNGFSLWSQADLKDKIIIHKQPYSKTHFFAEQNFFDRASLFDLSAELELSFMGGLISVKGSAHYLKDSRSTNEQVRVNMDYYAITGSETIPHSLPLTHPKYCEYAAAKNGPTHVISSVTHGMRAVFVFQRTTSKSETKEEVSGSLSIAVKSIPSFQISGKAVIDVHGKEVKNIDSIEVRFYGDVILNKTPTTYIDAVKVFDEIPSKVMGTKTVIKFQLTPITSYCDVTEAILLDINANLIDQTNQVLVYFSTLERDINSLASREVSQLFYSVRRTFNTLNSGLKKYSNSFKAELVDILPKLKAGTANESELITLINVYTDSPYEYEKAKGFLEAREREVNTIELVIQEALRNSDIAVTDASDANDNECIFRLEFATIYNMYVLPTDDVAENYINGIKESNETKWYDDTKKVGKAGRVFQKFVNFAEQNKGNNQCFLIMLKKLHPSLTISVSVLKNGDLITDDLNIPEKPETPTCLTNGYNSIVLGTKKSDNPDVTGFEVEFESLREDGNWTGSLTKRLSNLENLSIERLKPKTVYRLQTRYTTANGHTAFSDFVYCTTAPSSSPTTLHIVSDTSSEISLKWGIPTTIAPDVKPTYVVSISKVGEKSNVVLADSTTSTLEITLNNFESATKYNISVLVQAGTAKSSAVHIVHATAPIPPPQPTIENIVRNEATVVVNLAEMKLAVGMTLKTLELKYYKMNDKGEQKTSGTDVTRLVNIQGHNTKTTIKVRLGDLAAGMTYSVQLKVFVNNINGFSNTQYNTPTIFKTSYEKSDLQKFKESLGIEGIKSRIGAEEKATKTLLKGIEGIKSRLDKEGKAMKTLLNRNSVQEKSLSSIVELLTKMKRGDVTYTVRTKTGNKNYDNTDGAIYLQLTGKSGVSTRVSANLDNPKKDDRERGNVDEFKIRLGVVDSLASIKVIMKGDDGWRYDWMTISCSSCGWRCSAVRPSSWSWLDDSGSERLTKLSCV